MLLQFFTVDKRGFHLFHDRILFLCQCIRVFRVNRREIHIIHDVFLAVYHDGPFFKIDFIQQEPVLHTELRVTFDNLCFHLPLHNGNCLMHLCNHFEILIAQHLVPLRRKLVAGVISIFFHGKRCQRQKVNSIVFLNGIQICVPRLDTQHIADQRLTACRCPHPCDIVVAPLNIYGMVSGQDIHNLRRIRPSVIDISDNMQLVNGKPLYQVAECDNKTVSLVKVDNRMYDFRIIHFLVHTAAVLVQQLFYNIRKFLRQSLTHLGTRIF